MNLRIMYTIIRREMNDTLTDWRILTPILILTFFFPALLISGTNVAIRFIGDPEVIPRLIPFVMLLIGFIPASFSLITALESFVGERERNSLEALLSMPISDGQLYLAKLISSLMTPLLSAFMSVSVFGILLRWRFPDLFIQGLNLEIIAIVLLLTAAKALLMVSGAVIISSHTSSIRAANLLASFVLLPTAAIIQMEAILFISQSDRARSLLWTAVTLLFIIGGILVRTGMGIFNREEILSREHEQLNIRQIGATFRAFLRTYQPAGTPPSLYPPQQFSLGRFYRADLPRLLRDYRLPIGVALIAVLSGLIWGDSIGQSLSSRFGGNMLANLGQPPAPSGAMAMLLFANNLRATFFSSVFSLFAFGTFAFLVPAIAFGQISFVAEELARQGGSWLALGNESPLQFVLAYVLPHGIIELPAAILAAALGIRLGASLMAAPGHFSVGQNMLWSLAQFVKVWALVVVPLLLLGSLIEGLITPQIVELLYR